MHDWLTPDALDRERWRWRQWRPQKGGWAQSLWVVIQDEWIAATRLASPPEQPDALALGEVS